MNEQLLQDLVNQLRDLVPTLEKMGRSSTASGDPVEKATVAFDRSSTRIVTAIGKLAAQLDKNTRGKNAEQRSLKQFINEVDRATDAQEAYVKAADDVTAAAKELASAQQDAAQTTTRSAKDVAKDAAKLNLEAFRKKERESQNYAAIQAEEEQRLARSRNLLKDTLQSVAGENLAAQKTALFVNDALSGLGDVAKSTATTLASTLADLGQNGFNSFSQLNGVVDSVTGAITKMAGSIPFVGAAMTALAETTKFALNQIQQVSDNFRELSQVGALTADGMTGVRQALLDSGLTQQGLTNIVKQNAGAFATLGGTVGDGTKRFTKFVGDITKSPLGMQLRNLGLSADDIGEAAASYVEIQGRLGATQRMTQAQLTEGTIKYTRELDAITKITGMEKKELQSKMNAALSEQRFRAKMQEMERTGQGKVASQLNQMQAAISKTAPGLAQGFRDIVAAGGAVTTDAARQAMQATGGKISSIAQEVLRGGDIGPALGQLQTAVGEGARQFEKTAQFADLSGVIGNYAELVDFSVASAGDMGEAMKKATETVDKQAAGQDKYTNTVVSAQQQLELAAKSVQDLGFAMAEVAAPAVAKFAEVLNKVAGEVNDQIGGVAKSETAGETAAGFAGTAAGAAGGAKLGMMAGAALGPLGSLAGAAIGGVVGGVAGYYGGKSLASGGDTPAAPQRGPAAPTEVEGAQGGVSNLDASNLLTFTARSGSASAFDALDPRLKNSVLLAAQEYMTATGNRLIINSAKRDPADQERLYNETVAAGRPGIGPTGMAVAKPGRSPHENGLAVDIQNYNDPRAVAAMNRQGLSQKVAGDPVHFSFAKGGIASGPKSGYKAMLHGTEAVVPLPDGKTIPVAMKDSSSNNISKQMEMMGAQLMRLDEMVSLMRRQTNTGDKLLRVTQS